MILVGGDEVAAFVERQLGIKISEPKTVFGFVSDDKRPLCAVVANDYTGANVELTIVANPGGITRGVLRHLANYAFGKLGCRRITVRIKSRNKLALKMAERFGFKYEHVAKHFFEDDDAVVFRMLKQDCAWLPRAPDRGLRI